MRVTEILAGKSAVCREVSDDLPEWFGIPSAKDDCASVAASLPMFGCHDGAEPVAFISLKNAHLICSRAVRSRREAALSRSEFAPGVAQRRSGLCRSGEVAGSHGRHACGLPP